MKQVTFLLSVLVCSDNCVLESWIGDIILDVGKCFSSHNRELSNLLHILGYFYSVNVFLCDSSQVNYESVGVKEGKLGIVIWKYQVNQT